MSDGPWIDTAQGTLWIKRGHGMASRRHDDLWTAKSEERLRFVELARLWCAAAIADGWHGEPTYPNELFIHAWRLTRDGYTILGLSRPGTDKFMPTASVHIWGPDGLAIKPPLEYDSDAIIAGARTCSYCGEMDVSTHRVGFAGRACYQCLPDAKRKVETPGWNN